MGDREQWRNDLKRWGPPRFAYIRMMSFLRRWLILCRITSRAIDPTDRAPDLVEGPSVRIATRAELVRAARDRDMELATAHVEAALNRGDICASAFDGDRIVAYTWRSFTIAPHIDGLWVTFEPPYRYGYKSFTHPEYRGQHLQYHVGRLVDALCAERGYAKSLGFIESHNFSSIANSLRQGNRLVGWAWYIKLFGRVYPFRNPGARNHTFRFVRSEDL